MSAMPTPPVARTCSPRSLPALISRIASSSGSVRNWLSESAEVIDGVSWSAIAQPDHHVFDLGVLLERVDRHVVAVAGLLEAAVRHLRDDRHVVVDPHGAELEHARSVQRPASVV